MLTKEEDVIQHKDWYCISNSIVYENLDALEDEIYD